MKLNLQNKLLIVICCLFVLVFFSQFVFQNLFFNSYYRRYQTQILDGTIDEFYNLVEQKSLTKDKQKELTRNDKILIAYIDKGGNPLAGNIYGNGIVFIDTKNKSNQIINQESVKSYRKGYTEIVKREQFGVLRHQNGLSSGLYDYLFHGNPKTSQLSDQITKNSDNFTGEGDIVSYTSLSNINIVQHMMLTDYLLNPTKLKLGTEVVGSEEKYLIMTRSVPGGYMVASISMAQSDEIIHILNSFNRYIVLFTLVLVILLVMQFSRRIVKPILEMKKGAQAIAKQDFKHKVAIKTSDELEELADALNSISDSLEEKIRTLQSYNKKLKQEYEERLEIEQNQKNLLMNISHDLKTPLTVIKGYLKAIKDGVYNQNKYIDTAIDSVDDINNILTEMIELTKYRSKAYHLTLQDLDITRLIYKTYNDVFYLSKEKNQHVELDILDDVVIQADENAMRKVLDNLIINAIKYSPPESDIRIVLIKRGDTCELSIENDGVYIDEEDLKNIFEAFYRADKSRKEAIQGNGLGLSIVKVILDHHNYLYSIKNTKKGVRFSITMDCDAIG